MRAMGTILPHRLAGPDKPAMRTGPWAFETNVHDGRAATHFSLPMPKWSRTPDSHPDSTRADPENGCETR